MLDKIIDSCNFVMNNAKYVTINYNNLNEFIKTIDCKEIKHWLKDNPYNLLDFNVETIINLLLVFECICYSFWGEPKWKVKTREGFKNGSDALLYIMVNYVKTTNNTDFSNVKYSEFKKILKGNVEIPLLKERYNTITTISRIVNKKMNGSFYNYIKDTVSDRDLFNIIVNNFKTFKDERTYCSRTIYFYKLAQLLTSDILHIRENLENIKVDYSNLIGCSDYRVPQTLRALGITEYNNELANIVDSKKQIEISSKYEVEIRASQLVTINYIKHKLKSIYSIDINDYLFMYSKKVRSIAKPYHLCRNSNY